MNIAIIGGGASGLMAAITAAKNGACVTIYERCDRLGRKILATGNGRCNYTNINADLINYHGSDTDFVISSMKKFWVNEAIGFFKSIGMLTKVEAGGKAYPYSLQASAVLDVLRYEAQRLGITVVTDFEVELIEKNKKQFKIVSYSGNTAYAEKVIVCTGGRASPSLGSNGSGYDILKRLGHRITPLYPALVQIKTDTKLVKSLKGVKLDAKVCVKSGDKNQKSCGEVLFTEYGLSGPAVFNISRFCSKENNVKIILDLLPEIDYNNLRELLKERRSVHRNLENFFVGIINKKVGMALMKYADVLPYSRCSDTITNTEIDRLINAVKSFTLDVAGTMSWNNAQVTAGGIVTDDVNPETMESKLCKGLFITGELLDIDGDCGGYNLQWAWTSGYVAGLSASTES